MPRWCPLNAGVSASPREALHHAGNHNLSADFAVMQSLARALRVHVDALPDGPAVVRVIRDDVEPTAIRWSLPQGTTSS